MTATAENQRSGAAIGRPAAGPRLLRLLNRDCSSWTPMTAFFRLMNVGERYLQRLCIGLEPLGLARKVDGRWYLRSTLEPDERVGRGIFASDLDLSAWPSSDSCLIRRAMSRKYDWIDHEELRRVDAEQTLFADGHDDAYRLNRMALVPAPTADQERRRFLRFNFCKMKLRSAVERAFSRRVVDGALGREILEWEHRRALELCIIVRSMLWLADAVTYTQSSRAGQDDCRSVSYLQLVLCVDTFALRGRFEYLAFPAMILRWRRWAKEGRRFRHRIPIECDVADAEAAARMLPQISAGRFDQAELLDTRERLAALVRLVDEMMGKADSPVATSLN